MADREKVIELLLERANGAGADEWMALKCSMARDIVSMLKEQEARVMTLDQILETGGEEPIYLETPDMDGVIPAILQPDAFEDGYLGFAGTWRNSGYYHGMNYGKTWRCWTSRPTEEQRKAVKWE